MQVGAAPLAWGDSLGHTGIVRKVPIPIASRRPSQPPAAPPSGRPPLTGCRVPTTPWPTIANAAENRERSLLGFIVECHPGIRAYSTNTSAMAARGLRRPSAATDRTRSW